MNIYILEYTDSRARGIDIKAICTTKENAIKLLRQWYESEMAKCVKSLVVIGHLTINVQYPEQSMAEIVSKELNQWIEMKIRIPELDEWLWIKPKVVEVDDEL